MHLFFFLATYSELLAYLVRPDIINRNALLANAYEQFYARVAPITTPLLSMLLLCSTYFTVLVSGDRYFLICWPLIAEKIRTRKMAVRLVILVIIVVNIYIFPHWFEYRTGVKTIQDIRTIPNPASNQTDEMTTIITEKKLVELAYTKFGSRGIYRSIYRFYLNVPITFVIPFTLLTLCNGSMIHQLLLIKKKKKRLGHRLKADIRITTMLIVIVLTFMLCRSFNLFVNLLVLISPCLNNNSLQRINAFANLLTAFNGFINFFLFAAFGQRFREMVLYIFFRHGRSPFLVPVDGISAHRPIPSSATPTLDYQRRQSRRSSVNESDVWAAMSRRRPSATMAALYTTNDSRSRSVSHSITNSSHLTIPTFANNGKQDASNSSLNVTESPSANSSYQQLPQHDPDEQKLRSNSLLVPDIHSAKTFSPSCMKKKNEEFTPTGTHRVKFV